MAFHSSTAQKRENQIKSRHADEKGEGDSSDTLATTNADSDGYLSISLLPASWWLELIPQWGRSESKLMISLMESHCPSVKSCFFPLLISVYVQAASPPFPYFTPPSPTLLHLLSKKEKV